MNPEDFDLPSLGEATRYIGGSESSRKREIKKSGVREQNESMK